MEVSSEPGIMASRESSSFNLGLQKSPAHTPPPAMQSMRLAYTADGTAIYKPVSSSPPAPSHTYQGGGGGVAGDGSSGAVASHGLNINMGEPAKRKRGRPRKYGPDGLPLNPSSMAASAPPVSGVFSLTGNTKSAPSRSADAAKKRGRPPGSGKKHKMGDLGSAGSGFTPHVITVMAGEDVSSKIISFSQQGLRTVCVMSANGAVSNVTLRQPAASGGSVTYEGRFEILSLSGSFLLSESDGQRSRTGGLSVSLAGPDGRVLGGGVAGVLLAASPVQVIVGSFIPDGRKESKQINPVDPATSALGGKLAAGGTTGANSPPSRGTLIGSSGGGGGGGGGGPASPVNLSPGVRNSSSQQGCLSNIQWN